MTSDFQKAPIDEIQADVQVDACGLFCPEPVMMLHSAFRDMSAGQTLLLKATDPSTTRDVPKFCMFLGHDLLSEQQDDKTFYFLLKKSQV